jgi:hypothetical protein
MLLFRKHVLCLRCALYSLKYLFCVSLKQDVIYRLKIYSLFPFIDYKFSKHQRVSITRDHLQRVKNIKRKIRN